MDKQDILKIVLQELKKIWIKCNPRLILLNEKSIYVKLLRESTKEEWHPRLFWNSWNW